MHWQSPPAAASSAGGYGSQQWLSSSYPHPPRGPDRLQHLPRGHPTDFGSGQYPPQFRSDINQTEAIENFAQGNEKIFNYDQEQK